MYDIPKQFNQKVRLASDAANESIFFFSSILTFVLDAFAQ